MAEGISTFETIIILTGGMTGPNKTHMSCQYVALFSLQCTQIYNNHHHDPLRNKATIHHLEGMTGLKKTEMSFSCYVYSV